MTDNSTLGTVELLTRAADAAGKVATEIQGETVTVDVIGAPHTGGDIAVALAARRIAASGPDHWRAVAATFRDQLQLHTQASVGVASWCAHCDHRWLPLITGQAAGCPTLQGLRPLAEQVLRDLGDTG